MPKTRSKRKRAEQPGLDRNLPGTSQDDAGINVIDFDTIMQAARILPSGGKEANVVDAQANNVLPAALLPTSDIGQAGPYTDYNAGNSIRLSDDELSAHVPHSFRDQIQTGRYINLACLLKGSSELSELASGSILKLTADGQIESRPKQCTDKIANIERWTDAFIIFASIYLAKFPTKTGELLQYMFNIRESAVNKGGFAWRNYDEQFRLRQALNPSSWAHINSDLWWRCTLTKETSDVPSHTITGNKFTCNDFNNGQCRWPNCRFNHICSGCGGNHAEISCHSTRQGARQPFPRFPPRGRSFSNSFRSRGRPSQRGARQ